MFNGKGFFFVLGSGLAILVLIGFLIAMPAFAQGGGMMGNDNRMGPGSGSGPGYNGGYGSGGMMGGYGSGGMMGGYGSGGMMGGYGMGPGMMYLLDSLLGFGFALTAMLSTNVTITLWALIPLAGVCGGLFFFAPRIHLASRAVQDHLAALSARAQESFGGARVVKTLSLIHI